MYPKRFPIIAKMVVSVKRFRISTAFGKFFEIPHLLSTTMKFMRKFKCTPVKIHPFLAQPSEKILFETKNQLEIQKLKFRSHINCFAVIVQLLQLVTHIKYSTASKQSNHTIGNIFTFSSWLLFASWSCYPFLCRDKGPTLKVYLNSLFAFKKSYGSKTFTIQQLLQHSLIEFLNLMVVPMLLITCVIFPPIYVLGVHWKYPCKPSLVGHFMLLECYQWQIYGILGTMLSIIGSITKLIIVLVNMWIWSFAVHGCTFIFSTVHIISTMMLHENVVHFWERYKNTRDIYKDAILYRQLQILNILYNKVQQTFLGVFMLGVTLTLALNLSLLIGMIKGYYKESNLFMISINLIITIDAAAALLVIIGGMVSVYAESKRKLDNVKRLGSNFTSRFCRRWLRRYWRSCTILKTKFGDNNFLEESTPLTCLNLSFDVAVQFLLLARSK